jgi:hypothetical protein
MSDPPRCAATSNVILDCESACRSTVAANRKRGAIAPSVPGEQQRDQGATKHADRAGQRDGGCAV